jgi:hypothetical protein
MRRFSILVAVLAICTSGCVRTRADGDRESRVASALFTQFESVVHEEPSLLSSSGGYNHLSEHEAGNLRFPFAYLKGALETADIRSYSDLLSNSDAVLVGAKEFRPPIGLGAVRSKRCYVAILKDRSAFDFHRYFHQDTLLPVAGPPVWSWSAALSEFGENDSKSSSLFGAQVGNSYVLVSNDLQELQTLAALLGSDHENLQALNSVRTWASIRQYDIWGYRRYSHTDVADKMAAGMADVGPGAEALAFFLDSRKNVIALRLFVKPPSDQGTVTMMNSRATLPPLKPLGDGEWETTIALTGDEESFERTFIVVGLFGFPVYL